MFDLFIATIIFITSFMCHVAWHRWNLQRQKLSLNVISVYGVFFLVLSGVLHGLGRQEFAVILEFGPRLPIVAASYYCLLSILTIVLYGPYLLTSQVPAATILAALDRDRLLSKTQIEALFSESELLVSRLDSLQQMGMIMEKKRLFFVTPKGRYMYYLVHLTEVVLGISVGG
jgi:uncharacterized membrane protein